jgi:N-acetylglucosamine-6-phosphate deacetylase
MLALVHTKAHTPYEVIEDAAILIEDGRIVYCGPISEAKFDPQADSIDLKGASTFPGFIDVHIHGLLGHHAMTTNLREMIQTLPRFGVTSFLATTVTAPVEQILESLTQMAAVIQDPPKGANCLGIHLEGPHLSPVQEGAAISQWFRPLTIEEVDQFQAACDNQIKLITFAPEEGTALEFIPDLVARDIVPSIGHSDARYEQVEQAVKLGLRHATHTYNAMRPLHHRDPSVVGAVLAMPEITAELIADGYHVHPGAMRALINAKGVEGVCLISDGVPFAGMPDGIYNWGDFVIQVKDETCRLEDGTLAGSHQLMDRGFRNLVQQVGLRPEQAAVCASLVPARVLGVEDHKGSLRPGYDADLVVMDEGFELEMTLVGGEILWRA